MARYIDADKLIEAIEKDIEPYKSWDCTKADVIMDTILDAPTADVAEVVRCVECGFRDDNLITTSQGIGCYMCKRHKSLVLSNDFCSYGTPKERGGEK